MKLFAFKVAALLGVVIAAPMILPGPDGKPIMSLDDWIPRDLINSIGDGIDAVDDAVSGLDESLPDGSGSGQVYSWRDERGVLHYSDTPVEGAKAVDINQNTLEIPAENFVGDGPAQKKSRSGPSVFLLEDRDSRGSRSSGKQPNADLADIEALVHGDRANAAELLKNLPELLEQAKQARQIDPESR